jgi:hypothetical protein
MNATVPPSQTAAAKPSILDKAATLAADFVPVFPLRADKRPCTERGFKDASILPADIARMFADPAARLIGVPTGAASGFDAVDIDPDKGGDAWLRENGHRLPATRTHRTRRQGFHLLFQHRAGVRCSAGRIAPGVDIRGDDGYIVWWPADGQPIEDMAEPAAMPDWLFEAIVSAAPARGEMKAPLRPADLAPTSADDVLRLLRAMPNPAECGRDDYIAICLAVQGTIRGGVATDVLTDDDADAIMDAAAEWAARWEGATPSDFEAERTKWDSDWSRRDTDVSGWRQLIGHARRLGADVAGFREALAARDLPGLPPLPEEPAAPRAGSGGASEGFWSPWDEAVAPEFPRDCLPPLIREVAWDTHQRIGGDLGATAMAFVGAIAGAADSRTTLRAKHYDSDWKESPCLWVLLVGDPSTKKTPTINAVLRPHRIAEEQAMKEWSLLHQLWESTPKAEQGPKPPVPAYVINDTTVEKAVDLLRDNPRGLLCHQDELAGWIGRMEAYTTGRGSAANRSFWIGAWSGDPFRQDRKGSGTTYVERVSIGILGGIQPARLKTMGDMTDDGLLQRFIPVLMKRGTRGADRLPCPEIEGYNTLIRRLMEAPPRAFRLDEAGHRIKDAALDEFDDRAADDTFGAAFQQFAGKAGAMLLRLILVLHLADPANLDNPSDIIPPGTVERGRTLMDFVLRSGAAFYQNLSGGPANADTQALASYVLRSTKNTLALRDFVRNVRCMGRLEERQSLAKVSVLVGAGWLLPESEAYPVKKWTVAPGLRDHFRDRIQTEAARCRAARDLVTLSAEERRTATAKR